MRKKLFKLFLYTALLLFVLMNTVAFFHAYKFTHFSKEIKEGKNHDDKPALLKKAAVLLTGVDNDRPENKTVPAIPYQTIRLQSNKEIECWLIPRDSAIGTVVLFHGYGGYKSSMLDKSNLFQQMGYNTLLVDFMGSGGSEGMATTIGFKEAEQVKTTVDYLKSKGEENIVLFGTSMGAVAIMKAIDDYSLPVSSIIIECPFSTLLKTAENRFNIMGVPPFPLAHLLVFWGGVQSGYNAFAHGPVDYAKDIKLPTLLMYGGKDKKVTHEETATIYKNLAGPKALVTFPQAGHENYLTQYQAEWTAAVDRFLKKHNNTHHNTVAAN